MTPEPLDEIDDASEPSAVLDPWLARIVVDRGMVTSQQLDECLAEQKRAQQAGLPALHLAQLMMQQGLVSTPDLVQLLREAQEQLPQMHPTIRVNEHTEKVPSTQNLAHITPHLGGRTHISRYQIVGEIARGGMGVVYEAIDPDLKRRVALKVLKNLDGKPEHITRLNREAHLAARLSHPNIIPIHEVGATQDASDSRPVHFIAMDYIEGETLATALDRLDLKQKVGILTLVADAVGYAHKQGVIHRDLKPANILLTGEDRPIVTDFGLAREEKDSSDLTVSGAVMGTSHYMSPEQVLGQADKITARCDVWALGVILYEMLCGRRPFEGKTPAEIYHSILRVDPAVPRGPRRPLDKDLATICLKALEKEPARRYDTGREVCDDLRRWQDGEPIQARPASPFYRMHKRIKRHPWFVSGLLLSVVLIVLTGWWAKTAIGHQRQFRTLKAQARAAFKKQQWTNALMLSERALALFDDEAVERWAAACRASLELDKHRRKLLIQRSDTYKLLQDRTQPILRKVEETRPFVNIPNIAISGKLREVEHALAELERIAREPRFERWKFPDAWALLGQGYYLVGQMQKAEQALLIAAEPERKSDDWWVNYYLGRIYLQRALARQFLVGMPADPIQETAWRERAAAYLRRPMSGWVGAKEIDKDIARCFRLLAENQLDQVREACIQGKKTYRGNLGVAEYSHLLGYTLQGSARIKEWDATLKQRPHDAWIYFMRGCANQRLDRLTQARTDYDKALQISRHLAYAYNNRAVLRLRQGQAASGLVDLRRAIRQDDRLACALANLGSSLAQRGQTTEAIETLARASKLGAAHWQIWWRYGQLAAGQPGARSRALDALAQARTRAPDSQHARIDAALKALD